MNPSPPRPTFRAVTAILAVAALAFAWLAPIPSWLPGPFSAHMAIHMMVVALAAPLLALAVSGSRLDPLRRLPAPLLAIPASIVELLVVWGWHTPALHHFARQSIAGFAAEQGMFLTSALLVWSCACATERESATSNGPDPGLYETGSSRAAGVVALLLTSMHMTLLGALLALSQRPLYHEGSSAALADQHLGGALMLLFGGIVYLTGGLSLTGALLARRVRPAYSSPAGGRT